MPELKNPDVFVTNLSGVVAAVTHFLWSCVFANIFLTISPYSHFVLLKSFFGPTRSYYHFITARLVDFQPWWHCPLKGNTNKRYWFSIRAYHLSVKNKGNTLHREPAMTTPTELQRCSCLTNFSLSPISRFLGTFLLKWPSEMHFVFSRF